MSCLQSKKSFNTLSKGFQTSGKVSSDGRVFTSSGPVYALVPKKASAYRMLRKPREQAVVATTKVCSKGSHGKGSRLHHHRFFLSNKLQPGPTPPRIILWYSLPVSRTPLLNLYWSGAPEGGDEVYVHMFQSCVSWDLPCCFCRVSHGKHLLCADKPRFLCPHNRMTCVPDQHHPQVPLGTTITTGA